MAEWVYRRMRTRTQVYVTLKQEQRAVWPQRTEDVNVCLGLWGKVPQKCWTDFWRYGFEVYFQGENEAGGFQGENTAWAQMERNKNAWQGQQPESGLMAGGKVPGKRWIWWSSRPHLPSSVTWWEPLRVCHFRSRQNQGLKNNIMLNEVLERGISSSSNYQRNGTKSFLN